MCNIFNLRTMFNLFRILHSQQGVVMKSFVIGVILGFIIATALYAYKLTQPGAINVSLNLNRQELEKMLSQFNPQGNFKIDLNDHLRFTCPGKGEQTCQLSLISANK